MWELFSANFIKKKDVRPGKGPGPGPKKKIAKRKIDRETAPFKRKQKARKVEEYKAEKPMPIEQRPTKQQRK